MIEPALLDEALLVVQLGEFLPDRVDQLYLSPREAHQHRDHALSPGRSVGSRGSDDGPEVVAGRTRTLFRAKAKTELVPEMKQVNFFLLLTCQYQYFSV